MSVDLTVLDVFDLTPSYTQVQKKSFTLTKTLSRNDSSRSYCTKKGHHANSTISWFTQVESDVAHYLQFQFTRVG